MHRNEKKTSRNKKRYQNDINCSFLEMQSILTNILSGVLRGGEVGSVDIDIAVAVDVDDEKRRVVGA